MTEAKTIVLENTARRDTLIGIEKKYQALWAEEKLFEQNAPTLEEENVEISIDELHKKYPKFMSSMAYPYMNGVLHAGHCFTLSKVEFSIGFERMRGKRALFPLGFHCTGMPIKACADKLVREAEMFGKDYSNVPAEEEEPEAEKPKEQTPQAKSEDGKFKGKKTKAAAKQGRGKYQFEIMLQLGIPREELYKFADPYYWLEYFPPLCQSDCEKFGARIDWRRSMITTDMNPFYDQFVRWQVQRLKDIGKIKFGERYTIYSEKDGQPCMDHDRQSGEGVTPQEYVGIKIQITEFSDPTVAESLDSSKPVYLVAATLRPETMYGQTCCFVSPKIDYGIFDNGKEYFITTERAYKNMSYQKITPQRGDYKPTVVVSGKRLIGSKIKAPLAQFDELRVLPMETVLATKGTGVVTCVPSDSPDDYITTKDLQNKPEYYGIDKDWVRDPVPLIKTEKYGNMCAEYLCKELKIQSPKDSIQLAKAKEAAYKEGFYSGIMDVGPYKGEKVEVAKPKVKADLIATGEAFVYSEPESQVVSRSGDICIVSLEDQWYVDYGEKDWKSQAVEALESMNTFTTETRNGFEGVLDWLKNWAVCRTYGLGTRLPWDEKYLVESLSDSTIYQAYYTISHLLHTDYYGKDLGKFGITPEQMTADVFDYIFLRKEDIKTEIPLSALQTLRREFEYFYPLDVSISGKDLIPNHLTFFIYTHTAIFPKRFWPAGIRANGHLLLNNNKMSKSTGNFMTLEQVVEKFGADASRIALADAGDTLEDANFEEANANAAILRLTTLKEWAEDAVKNIDSFRDGEFNFFDIAFENELNDLIEQTYTNYELTNYKTALKTGLFDYQTARDYYREASATMHRDLVLRYIETQVLLLTPVAPHFADYVWREVLGKKTTIQSASFPRASKPVDYSILESLEYIRGLSRSIRETEGTLMKKKKGKGADVDQSKPVKLTIFISENFPEWQNDYIEIVRELFEKQSLNDNAVIKEKVGKDMKRAMPFISNLKQRLVKESPDVVFNRELNFDEVATVKTAIETIKRAASAFKVHDVQVISFKNGTRVGTDIFTGEEVPITITGKIIDSAVPGQPGLVMENI
ncbi:leucine--tRNA ligase CDC60 [Cyberlindnera jadinii NRRL Y-1542]|uniref:leucine--tRNA ligase n=1 Tax=Cyberlindnera jadinii (strain ATCC 18201 / CBS 1600 / BCRC 20928 / JCM 3617 / NBRC 0987 / NRRL Y-1542) TaxID=983966 RepID=A0A1E4S5A5_CYBJN|nr:leucyl-tRNA synthetase [Cyberlindnera jadinii NRRL Y-1542]ODV74633.1 leucyl-tRNA synthetase [Cyberlindnera jadinii NRRL Y-1542]